jgi:hypothetical protein
MFILGCIVFVAPVRESCRGLEFCHLFRVEMRCPDSPHLWYEGGRSGRRLRVRICVEVALLAVSATGGVEPASLASMARVTGLGELLTGVPEHNFGRLSGIRVRRS